MSGRVNFSATIYGYALNVIDCARCGMVFAITQADQQRLMRSGQNFYCPNGHTLSFGDSREKQLQRELEAVKRQLESQRTQREWAVSRAKGAAIVAGRAKAAKARLEMRIARGVCPCCKRTVKQLAAHMKSKHPGYGK